MRGKPLAQAPGDDAEEFEEVTPTFLGKAKFSTVSFRLSMRKDGVTRALVGISKAVALSLGWDPGLRLVVLVSKSVTGRIRLRPSEVGTVPVISGPRGSLRVDLGHFPLLDEIDAGKARQVPFEVIREYGGTFQIDLGQLL